MEQARWQNISLEGTIFDPEHDGRKIFPTLENFGIISESVLIPTNVIAKRFGLRRQFLANQRADLLSEIYSDQNPVRARFISHTILVTQDFCCARFSKLFKTCFYVVPEVKNGRT